MNGVHDMGGMDGFGPVVREVGEPVFHADWEGRLYGIVGGLLGGVGVNIDEFRHAVERIPPARYLASSYYERWLAALETLLVEHGVATREELRASFAKFGADAGIDAASIARAVQTKGPAPLKEAGDAKAPRARFAKGDRVRARNLNPPGHTRLPRFVRGRSGVVARDWGVFVFADTNAHHAGKKPQHCYSVAFDARELWGKPARTRERIYIDLWEDYLEPIESKSKSKPRRKAQARKKSVRRPS
ncbi:MAG TPA: nitrile hydratase subunit beta [Candidatus Acidoferrales bacterium]|nr:nitrile hydratase subunit beta [Candidatus Acidoferrales bacterium]